MSSEKGRTALQQQFFNILRLLKVRKISNKNNQKSLRAMNLFCYQINCAIYWLIQVQWSIY